MARKITSPNTFIVRYTADRLIRASKDGSCSMADLVKEVQKKYRDVIVRYDLTIVYLIGGDYYIDCKEHKIYKRI